MAIVKARKAWVVPAIALLVGLPGCSVPPPEAAAPARPEPTAANADQAAFIALGERYIQTLAQQNPVAATMLGSHEHDGDLPDITAAGRSARLTQARAMLGELEAIDRSALTPDQQVDAALLDNALRYEIWRVEELQEWAWNPQVYNDTASYAVYSLVARDFAPWPDRLTSAIERMEKLPAFFAEARRQLDPARVPKVHAEIVAQQTSGIMETVNAALLPEAEKIQGVERSRFDAALGGLKAAVAEHQKWLDEVLVPGAKGDPRIGPELYDAKMRFALMSPLSRSELKQRAQAAFLATRTEMYALAQEIGDCGKNLPAALELAQQQAIECALALSYQHRPTRDRLEAETREALAEAAEFTRRESLVAMPEGSVQIITMPRFWQGNAVAYDDPPGPLEPHLPNYFAVSPVPDEWTDEQATSFLSEYNDYMLRDLAIHEGVPGHYLQLDHARRHPDLLRSVLESGPFIEGWAVYAEGAMADAGFMDGDPLFKLTVLKMRLRSIVNTLLDIGIHTEGMTREEAMDLMMKGAFQQEREAAGKWTRANLTSVQLLSYFTGYTEHMALREEAKRRWGNEFTLRRYHDAVIGHGSPPVKYVRALMFGLPVE